MLSPKRSMIQDTTGTFGADERALWLPLLVGSAIYNRAFPNFVDVSVKLDSVVDGSLQAKQLNATMILLDRIGPVAAKTTGQDGEYSTVENREGLLEYAFSVLYGVLYWSRISFAPPCSYRLRNTAVIR